MPVNQLIPFANAPGANALSASDYAALGTILTNGFSSGVAKSSQFNALARQLSVAVAGIGQFTADNQGSDVLDDGSVANFEAKFKAALLGAVYNTYLSKNRIRLFSNLPIYLDSTNGSDSNTGTSAAPFKTLQAAVYYAQTTYDSNGYTITFTATASAFTAGAVVNGPFVGQNSAAAVVFALGSSTITCVASCFYASSGAMFNITSSGPLSSSGAGYGQGSGIFVGSGSQVGYSGINFGTCVTGHVTTSAGGVAGIGGAYTISGNAPTHFNAQPFGVIQALSPAAITLVGTPAFSTAFAYTIDGFMSVPNLTFTGSAMGRSYYIDGGGQGIAGAILVGGATLSTYFPGNVAGASSYLVPLAILNNLSDLASVATALGNLGFTSSSNGNAWVATLPTNGRKYIIQGNVITITTDAAVYFPNAFPNALLYLSEPHVINANGQTTTAVYKMAVDTLSATGFAARGRVIQNGGTVAAFTGGLTIHYLAIGY